MDNKKTAAMRGLSVVIPLKFLGAQIVAQDFDLAGTLQLANGFILYLPYPFAGKVIAMANIFEA